MVSADLISRVTDKVIEELSEGQDRPLDYVYAVIFIDAVMVKVRDGAGHQPAIYASHRDRLRGGQARCWACGSGPPPAESAKFWLTVLFRAEVPGRG